MWSVIFSFTSYIAILSFGLGVLGCTGSVGQRFILLLAKHPHFTVHALGASSRSEGKRYKDAVRWKQDAPMSADLGDLVIRSCEPENFKGCDIVFSGLDADVAGDIGRCQIMCRFDRCR